MNHFRTGGQHHFQRLLVKFSDDFFRQLLRLKAE
jgi:hypothetical protein